MVNDEGKTPAPFASQRIDISGQPTSSPTGIPGMDAATFSALERGQISMREAQRRMAQNPPGHPHFTPRASDYETPAQTQARQDYNGGVPDRVN